MHNETSNLFSYATKELSQDAFLRWLFENWNSSEKDIRTASRYVLCNLFGYSIDFDKVKEVETRAQEKGIDILVFVRMDNVEMVLLIEDKTYSGTHDGQLARYKAYVEKIYNDIQSKFVYYKTSLVSEDERKHVVDQGYDVYDVSLIANLFDGISIEINNSILSNYIEYISKVNLELNGRLPDNIYEWNINHWCNFGANHNIDVPNKLDFGFGNYRNQYIYLVFNIKGKWHEHPYAEIRSRDLNDNDFRLRILLYDTKKDYLEKYLHEWKEMISNSDLFINQNFKQQIASNNGKEEVYTKEDLEQLIKKYMDEYLRLML